ncbi:MAG: hypothetical protein M3409_09715 [Gemmatimonadota bacterium]|nr:hypothetical protein [Gemmatimonadota bacterium]
MEAVPRGGGGSPACIGVWGQWFGHRYRARYDERITHPAWLTEFARRTGRIEMQLHTVLPDEERLYVGDVCTRCGHRVKRYPMPEGGESRFGSAAPSVCLPGGDLLNGISG